MLIILTISLVTASILLLFAKKSEDSLIILGLCLSLMLEICGVMIFIGKKGGISNEVLRFLFISKNIQTRIRYLMITLNVLGYIIALGRTLFPLFLLEMSFQYSMIPVIRKNRILKKVILVLPILTLILYFPLLYKKILGYVPAMQDALAGATLIWITLYLILSAILMFYEYFSITMKYCKMQFIQIMVFLISVTGLYVLYYFQDPGQVYGFYSSSNAWNRGIGYLQISPSLFSYMLLVIVNIICSILGFYSIARFTRGAYEVDIDDIVMERKFSTAKVGASMFVHSMKNQLLSSKVVLKRMDQLYRQPEMDLEKMKEYTKTLEDFNEGMLLRMEELYRCVKTNTIYMVPTNVEEILENTMERFHGKYPEAEVDISKGDVTMILADKIHFCEALYNLLINAQEAVMTSDGAEQQKICLSCHNERLYTVFEVRDHGPGIAREQQKRIFDPFYSSKNSNVSWGMGLYYVREIVKSHLGLVRVESKKGEGSSFFILIPRYD